MRVLAERVQQIELSTGTIEYQDTGAGPCWCCCTG